MMKNNIEERPTISRSDVKLRLFIDTNVLIDYVEEFDEKKSKTFIELFRNTNFENIELVTSDYVLWEFYDHFKKELYVKKLVEEFQYGYINANRECIRKNYRKASLEDMETFGNTIRGYVEDFAENPVSIQRLIGQKLDGFSEMVEKILQCSKFSYPDTIVFVSALFTNSHIIITLDETFSSENHLQELKNSQESLRLPEDIEFKKPEDFSTEELVNKNYKMWFLKHNREKQIGKVIKVWPKKNTIAIECLDNYFINQGDYLCLVKFRKGAEPIIIIFKVKEGNLRDYNTKKAISRGEKVTVKLPSDVKCEPYMQGSMIFLYSEM